MIYDLPPPAIIRPAEQLLLKPNYLPKDWFDKGFAVGEMYRSGKLTKNDIMNSFTTKMPLFTATLIMNQFIGFNQYRAYDPLLLFLGYATSSSDATTYNLGNFYSPISGLLIVCSQTHNQFGAVTLSAINVDGVATTLAVNTGAGTNSNAGMGTVAVTPNTQGYTVQVVSTGTSQHCGIFVYLLPTGYSSATPSDTASGSTAGTSFTSTLNLDVAGVTIWSMHVAELTTAPIVNFSTVGVMNNKTQTTREATFASAFITHPPTEVNHAETVSWVGSGNFAHAAATWK